MARFRRPDTAETSSQPQTPPAQTPETQPGHEAPVQPVPLVIRDSDRGSGKLAGRVARVTGGDSGIGRAVAVHFAREGADVAIVYLDEHEDAHATLALVEAEGRRGIPGDIGDVGVCRDAVERTVSGLGGLHVLVNNAAEQHPQQDLVDITPEQLERTFRTNIFAMFYLTQAALSHLRRGDAIINTTSITAYRGSPHLLDYSSTKGAIVAFTRSLSANLAARGVRVNAVAPGPIWTPLIPGTSDGDHVEDSDADTPLGRVGQPADVAPAFVFLACEDSAYITGQVIHPDGGDIVNS